MIRNRRERIYIAIKYIFLSHGSQDSFTYGAVTHGISALHAQSSQYPKRAIILPRRTPLRGHERSAPFTLCGKHLSVLIALEFQCFRRGGEGGVLASRKSVRGSVLFSFHYPLHLRPPNSPPSPSVHEMPPPHFPVSRQISRQAIYHSPHLHHTRKRKKKTNILEKRFEKFLRFFFWRAHSAQ